MSVPEYRRDAMGPCCMCGATLHPNDSRDRPSYREAHITGLCQACQDLCFLACDGGGRPSSLYEAALVARRAFDHRVAEVAFFPFRLVVPDEGKARVAWEARHILRAGPWLDPLDARLELEPAVAQLGGHQVCVTHHTLRDPPVLALLDRLHLLVALDDCELADVARVCPLADDLSCATFEEVPWLDAFGRPLLPLATWWLPDPGPLSTLRTLATLASLLVDEGRNGRRPVDYLLASRPGFFEDESDVDV